MSIECGQYVYGTTVARIYTINTATGHNIALCTTKIFQENPDDHWMLPANAALEDVPQRIAELPYVEFYRTLSFRLPNARLDTPLETHDCVVENGTHGQRYWIRALYSSSAPINAALRDLCVSAKLPPWRGEIAVIALGKKTPFLKAVNSLAAGKAIIKCAGLNLKRGCHNVFFHLGS